MLFATMLACAINNGEINHSPHADVALASIDAGTGNGQSVAEFVSEATSADLSTDWSFLNLPAFSPDAIGLSPLGIPSSGDCSLDDNGSPIECAFWVSVEVSSSSGWWDSSERSDLVSWMPGQLHFCFGGSVSLEAEQAAAVSASVEDDGIAFSGDLSAFVCRGADGSGEGLPDSESQVDVFTVSGGDDNSGVDALFAADDTLAAQ